MDIQKISSLKFQIKTFIVNDIYTIEPFDSELLGYGVGRLFWQPHYQNISEEQVEQWGVDYKVNLLFVYVTFRDLISFNANSRGYILISSKIVYELKSYNLSISSPLSISDSFEYDSHNSYWIAMTQDLSATSHYAKDPFIGKEKAFSLYQTWMKNTFTGYAEKVFVAHSKDIPMGFISLRNKDDGLHIDLIAVHSDFRGKGIAKELLRAAIQYAQDHKKFLLVCTQIENVPANRLYQKAGFVTKSFSLIYHKNLKGKQ